MADISVTATAVVAGSNAQLVAGTAGATITAGQTLYQDASDSNKIKLADANGTSATAAVWGIALHAASSGQPIQGIGGGSLTINSVLTTGVIYVASATAGGIAPAADIASGWRTSVLGVATSATTLALKLHNSDAATA